MFSRSLGRDSNAISRPVLAFIIVVLVVSSSAAGLLLTQAGSSKTVQKGTAFKADYIGKFTDGRVFDTSLYSVATDNATYPKSLTYQWSNNTSRFAPVEFTQGSSSLIKGFNSGVLGMSLGEWKNFTVSPQDGYTFQATKQKNISINSSISVDQWMSFSQFNTRFGYSSSNVPKLFLPLIDPIWGWNATVSQVNASASMVKVTNQPESGKEYKAYAGSGSDSSMGWKVKVLSNNGAQIQVLHLLTAEDARHVKGYDPTTKSTVILDKVDIDANQAVLYSGREVDGQTLIFTVHVVSIS